MQVYNIYSCNDFLALSEQQQSILKYIIRHYNNALKDFFWQNSKLGFVKKWIQQDGGQELRDILKYPCSQ